MMRRSLSLCLNLTNCPSPHLVTLMRTLSIVAFASLLCISTAPANAQTSQKLIPGSAAAGDHFGLWVDVSGDVAIVGALSSNDNQGSAYVYRADGGGQWTEAQRLVASDGSAGDLFGASVSVSDNIAVVAAPHDADLGLYTGAAYVFYDIGSTFIEGQRLIPSDRQAGQRFGYSVSVSGNVAVVSAREDSDNGQSAGAAYVFRFNGSQWTEEQKLVASDGAADDQFGFAVCVSGDVAIISAYADDDLGISSGSAYIFRFVGGQWVEEQKLLASDGASNDFFGRSVSIDGNVAIVGSALDDDIEDNSGSAYIFRFNGNQWVEDQKLLASDGAQDDNFGSSVSVSGDMAAVGAYRGDGVGVDTGSAYVYVFDGGQWSEVRELQADDGAAEDEFGFTVGVSSHVVFVGAPGDDDMGEHTGSVYVQNALATHTEADTPVSFSLGQNYPNPFNPRTTIHYALDAASDVTLKVLDLLGRQVQVLAEGSVLPGAYQVSLDATGFPSGVYFYTLTAGSNSETRKMVLLR